MAEDAERIESAEEAAIAESLECAEKRAIEEGGPSHAPSRSRERLLRAGSGLHADLRLVERDDGAVVLKDYSRRPAWLRSSWARWICAREQAVYRQIEDRLGRTTWCPHLVDAGGPHAFALSYRPGRPLSRALAQELPEDFLPALERAVAALHGAGIVHLDLSHRSNVLVDAAGGPVVLDFASAVRVTPGGLRHRMLLALLAGIDRRALRKWRRKLGRESGAGRRAD